VITTRVVSLVGGAIAVIFMTRGETTTPSPGAEVSHT
jgi:hypothetical protein